MGPPGVGGSQRNTLLKVAGRLPPAAGAGLGDDDDMVQWARQIFGEPNKTAREKIHANA